MNINKLNVNSHIIIAVLLGLLFLVGTTFVSAEGRSDEHKRSGDQKVSATTTNSKMEEKKQEREEMEQQREENKETRRVELEEKRKERVRAYTDRLIARMNAAINRYYRLADRVESRIAKIEEKFGEDVDLSESKELLETARLAIDEAASSTSAISEEIETAIEEQDLKGAFKGIRALFVDTKDSIRNAHRALVNAIKSVRVALGLNKEKDDDDDDNATSTATSTDTTNATSTATTTDQTNGTSTATSTQ